MRTIEKHDRALAPPPFFICEPIALDNRSDFPVHTHDIGGMAHALGADLAYQAVHSPLQAPDRYVAMCDAEGVREPQRRIFCGMVKALDEGVGNISRRLRASPELMESTIIVFATDK